MKKMIIGNLLGTIFVVVLLSCNALNSDGQKVDFFIKNFPGDPVAIVNSVPITKSSLESNLRQRGIRAFNSDIKKKQNIIDGEIQQ
ncbi:MAG: hypothetical protein O2897_03335, partial [bacterium]|nr:hypothetical protein [bacterium]